ncbi:hypothetical protein LC613_03450 [Nostoc sphaeroides CHAB 2801]|uniref:hypothetical protein n=1 Tax=Nostoc sphaeroides TaxID=446679 RepID=UPI0015F34424|nr:hypothetical protein [Nostoc sphaeroides]MCC5627270.1 hypothetical protein [Nostoc sphaeroides CHAB 2801]
MADSTDVLLKLSEQRWAEVKQAEDQRSALNTVQLSPKILVETRNFASLQV